MAAVLKLRYLILIGILHSKFSYGFPHNYEMPYNGVEIVTYGEPCQPPRYLPVTIEEPVKAVVEFESPEPYLYKPLNLNYQIISDQPVVHQLPAQYPISIQVPEVPQSVEIITPDPLRSKSYVYNVQAPPSPSVPISTNYNFDLQLVPSSFSEISTPKSIKYLTGLNSKIDKILIPAYEVSSSWNCA